MFVLKSNCSSLFIVPPTNTSSCWQLFTFFDERSYSTYVFNLLTYTEASVCMYLHALVVGDVHQHAGWWGIKTP